MPFNDHVILNQLETNSAIKSNRSVPFIFTGKEIVKCLLHSISNKMTLLCEIHTMLITCKKIQLEKFQF